MGENHSHTTIALDACLAIVIDMKNVLYWLNSCFQKKMEVSFGLLRKHPCFANVSED